MLFRHNLFRICRLYKFTLLKLAKNCGFAVPILPSLILNKKNGGHNILWSAFYLIFEDISIYP